MPAWGQQTYNQTDIAGVTNNFSCDGTTASASSNRFDKKMVQSGTAGTVQAGVNISANATQIGYSLISPSNITAWPSGNWTVRVDISSGTAFVTLDGICIFRVDSAGTTNLATVGTATGLALPTNTGVIAVTVASSAQTPAITDKIYIEYVFINPTGGTRGFGIKSDSTVDTTVTSAPATLTSIAVTPTGLAIASGAMQQFTATGTYSDSSTQDITSASTWSSTSTATATINASTGLATGVALGTTNIQATLSAITGSTTLSVTKLDIYGGDSSHACVGLMKPGGSAIPGATGFFYFYADTGIKHWMVCDPLGNRFWVQAVQLLNCMSAQCASIVAAKYASLGVRGYEIQEVNRLRGLGFNALGEYPDNHAWPDTVFDGGNPNHAPFTFGVSPGFYGHTRDHIKTLMEWMPPAYQQYRGGQFTDIFDPVWTSTSIPKWGTVGNTEFTPFIGGAGGADASPYLMWLTLDDADYLWGFKGFTAPETHLGWMVGILAPYIGGYADPVMYIRQQFQTYLCSTVYANVGALNAAWGSTYTTCGSSATTITGESVGTGNGVTTTFNKTLAHTLVDPASIGIYVTGTLNGYDDCPWFTGIPCTGGLTSGTGTFGPAEAGGTVSSGTVTYATGVISVTFSSPPANGAAITATYQYGGWPKATSHGTGLLDEDGTSAWYPNTSELPDPPVGTVGLDLNAFLGQIAQKYFSATTSFLRTAYPHHVIIGPNPLGSHSRAVVLAQEAAYVDAFFLADVSPQENGSTVPFDGKTGVLAVYNTYGVPVVVYELKAANPDSPYPGTPCSIPNSCFPTQAARGASYYNALYNYYNIYVGTDTYKFVLGVDLWQLTDNPSESQNFGLTTLRDNLYNGTEDVNHSIVDQYGFTTTPEAANYGDWITPNNAGVFCANQLWLTAGLSGGPGCASYAGVSRGRLP